MSRRFRCGVGLAVLLLSLGLLLRDASGRTQAVVRVLPAGGTFASGAAIPVQLRVEDVAGLYGADVRLSFDPSRLAVVEAQVAPGYELLWPDMVVLNRVDNRAGTVEYAAVQLNPRPPASGAGALFSFSFRALGPGPAAVSVTAADLSDIDGMPLECTTEGAVYTLEGIYRVFLPLTAKSD